MDKKDNLIYFLSKKMLLILFVYYAIILILGIFLSIRLAQCLMYEMMQSKIITMAFLISMSVSGMLCSIQYIKRLYKACLTERIKEEKNFIKNIGNMIYFIFRPIFAVAFSIIMVFGLLSGMFVVTGNIDYILNEKFIYLCVILSSILGYSIGKLMDKFEVLSEIKIQKIQ